jgi:nucleotidyltransferase substrate binding protein (TIGR01987 family)
MTTPLAERLDRLAAALDRLEELVEAAPAPGSGLADGAIQRFEFSFEAFWRALRAALALQGIEVASPRAAMREAYAQGWLEEEAPWLAMIEARNLTSHTYNAETAAKVLAQLPDFLARMRVVAGLLARPAPRP